jgi:4-amino-4-deoxy-L-arabinose transferase-like glycosyltransferase
MEASTPRSLPAWLPFLWSRVLFPGTSSAAEEPRTGQRLALAVLLVLPALLLYPCLSFALFEPDEGRYAQIPREMLNRGDLIVPVLQGEPYLDKPPLFYWLVALSYRLFGVAEWSARLVPALAVHATILVTWYLGRRSLGGPAAFLGALLLALAPGFTSVGRLLLLDSLLALWATLALFGGFEAVRGERFRLGWWLLAAVACGLGVLTKGPVALVLLLPPLWLQRRLAGGQAPSWRAWLAFAALVLMVALPWYVVLACRLPGFVRHFLWEHHVLRFLTPFAHEEGVFFYVPILLGGLLPGTLLLVSFVRFLLAGSEERSRLRTPALGFCLLGAAWCVFFFTLSSCKLPTYVLPAYPPLTLALGYYIAHGPWRKSRLLLPIGTTAFLLLFLAHHVVVPWYATFRSPLRHMDEVARLCDDPEATVVCYPRPCDTVAFTLNRDDLRNYRSKDIEELRALVREKPRVVILCTHRHSLQGLKQLLPPEVRVTEAVHVGLGKVPLVPERYSKHAEHWLGETALGLSDVAVVERPTERADAR